MTNEFEYDEEESRKTERSALAPEAVRQRMRTLEVLGPRVAERIVDVGCGAGLLVQDLALAVGLEGRVVGVDNSVAMLELARRRCTDLPQVELIEGDATELGVDGSAFDAVACTQVLLYVEDIDKALDEMQRVLVSGGRIAIIETDWRGLVLNNTDQQLTDRIVEVWDQAVPSPNLPVRLAPLLRQHGFTAVHVEALPVLCTERVPESWSVTMLDQFARLAHEQGPVSEAESRSWLEGIERLGAEGAYFFCVNRFLFSAIKR